MIRREFKVLEQILGCYFHQDYLEDSKDEESVFREIIDSEPRDRLTVAANQIAALLSLQLSEDELGKVLSEQLGCYFHPKAKGLTCSQWLRQVQREFKRP
jgi:hypothetical protein